MPESAKESSDGQPKSNAGRVISLQGSFQVFDRGEDVEVIFTPLPGTAGRMKKRRIVSMKVALRFVAQAAGRELNQEERMALVAGRTISGSISQRMHEEFFSD